MKKLIDFTERQLEIVNFVKEREGHKSFMAALAVCIVGYYNSQYYTKHKEKQAGGGTEAPAVPTITGEQLCEAVGGKLSNGMCAIKLTKPGQIGGVTITLPVGDSTSMLKVINMRRHQAGMEILQMADLVQKKELTTGAGS